MNNMPGAFPFGNSERIFTDATPSSREFNFTPSRNNIDTSSSSPFKRTQLYPSLNHMNDRENLSNQCSDMGYSKKLSNKVLSELDQRAAQISNHPTSSRSSYSSIKKSMLSPRSSRFNSSHRNRFQKMDSISSHYAAVRTGANGEIVHREEMELDKENNPSYDPNSKRSGVSILASASKRRKTEYGKKEIMQPTQISPSKRVNNLHQVLHSLPEPPRTIKEPISKIPRSPSKSTSSKSASKQSLKPSVSFLDRTSNKSAPRSTSSLLKKNTSSIPSSRTISSNISGLTASKKLPRSTTLNNLTRPTAASMQRSTSTKNLQEDYNTQRQTQPQQLRSMTSRSDLSQQTVPRSKSTMNMKSQAHSKPVWR